MEKRLLTIIAILATLPVVAEELPEILKPSYYGKCMVVPSEAGEDLAFVLNCKGKAGEGVLVGPPQVGFMCERSKAGYTILQLGTVYRASSGTIDVFYQFDGGEVRGDSWQASRNTAFSTDHAILSLFLTKMLTAEHLHFQIGDSEPATIEFDEQTSDAVRDFKDRCASLATE